MANDLTPVMAADDCRGAARLSLRGRRPPAVVPGYELEQPLGEGAFGEVWVAVDQNTGCRVAIKFYSHRGGQDWAMLSREVEKLRFLRADRQVVQLLAVGWNATPPYYVMEYMERGSLEEHLAKSRPSVPEALELTREVARGLAHAHAKGILHCDLKPANILLDQDGKPRLADFGQARLTHEQNPALGTLFYMAPEQADLKATPDVRWDVYALGALLYRMLTGQPPFRGESGETELHQTPHLEELLRRYRLWIARSPRPAGHLKVPGVDRRLADIIDRCLAVAPEKRFANVQAVVEALDNRALRRARRPLLVLGAVMPVLFLVVVALFALRGLRTTVAESDRALTRRALLSDRFAAQFAATTVANRVTQRWNVLEKEAQKGEFHKLIYDAADKDPDHPDRARLLEWLDDRRREYVQTTTAKAWFLMDVRGTLVAVSPFDPQRNSLGKDLSSRSYFHGEGRDYTEEEMKGRRVGPIRQPTQSVPFVSSSGEKRRMVVFSVPVRDGAGETLGVLGMGVNVGDFTELLPEGAADSEEVPGGRCAVLVETRADRDGQRGIILQHPWLGQFEAEKRRTPNVRLPDDRIDHLRSLRRTAGATAGDDDLFEDYADPVGAEDAAYQGRWLAAAAPVVIEPRNDGDEPVYTGWVVVVQERSRDAAGPVRRLEGELLVQGLETLALLLVIMAALWGSVVLLLNDSPRSRLSVFLRRRAGLKSGAPKTSAARGGTATVQSPPAGGRGGEPSHG